jgi:hypothetical protein
VLSNNISDSRASCGQLRSRTGGIRCQGFRTLPSRYFPDTHTTLDLVDVDFSQMPIYHMTALPQAMYFIPHPWVHGSTRNSKWESKMMKDHLISLGNQNRNQETKMWRWIPVRTVIIVNLMITCSLNSSYVASSRIRNSEAHWTRCRYLGS